eukprot:5602900-Amphidinium_carterae.1
MRVLRSPGAYAKFVDGILQSDTVFFRFIALKSAVVQDWHALQYAAEELYNHSGLMRAAATQSLDSLQHASERVLLEEGFRRFTCQGHV